MKIEGKIKQIVTKNIETEDGVKEVGQLIIDGTQGEKISLTGEKSIVDGFFPDEQVILSLSKVNQTLDMAHE